MASLSLAVPAWRFGMPAPRAGARRVVENEVAGGVAHSASGALCRSGQAPRQPGEPALPQAWVRSTRSARATSDHRPRRAARSRCSAARAWSDAPPAGLPGARSEDLPPPERSSCEARAARLARRRRGEGARALASLLPGSRAGRDGSWGRGRAFAERSGSRASAGCPASRPPRNGVAEEPRPRARDELVRASRVGVVGVLAQDFIRALGGSSTD